MDKIAIIDMGTNTFHLLLAEVGTHGAYRILHRAHEAVKIGKEGINNDIITEAARLRALEAMHRFRRIIDDHGVTDIYAYGTSAFRNARNGTDLANEINSLTGITVRIISGDEEASFIFAGIRAAVDLGTRTSLVMDIGAGSVEFIIGDNASLHWKESFEIGGQRLLEKYMHHDPITEQELSALYAYFEEALPSLVESLHRYRPDVLVGSSGSFDTLSEIDCARKNIPYRRNAPETPLSTDGFHEIYRELITKNREERMAIPGMIEMRVDMIVVGSCLVRFVLEQHPFSAIRVSTYSLKEGVLATLAGIGR